MSKLTKRKKQFQDLYDRREEYSVEDAVAVLKKAPKVGFDQTVEISMKLNLSQSSDPIRGALSLPNGTGREIKIAAFCKGDKLKEAQEAGADHAGADDLMAKVSDGWMDFDAVVATPDIMKDLARLGKVLGPRGLMPNPKAGTVTNDIGTVVKELRRGKIEFRMDKQSEIKGPVGKLSFKAPALSENIKHFVKTIFASNPKLQKPANVRSIYVSSTMGPGIKLKITQFRD